METKAATANLHDMWQEALSCDISTSVVLRGEQTFSVRVGEDSRGRHIACQLGRVLLYLYDEEAVRSHCQAWVKASSFAERAFPADYSARGPRNAGDANRSLSVATVTIQCEREQRPVDVDAATTAAAGLPYVQVRVGRLIVVCLDETAVTSATRAWADVGSHAEAWFTDPDVIEDQRGIVKKFERGHRWSPSNSGDVITGTGVDLTKVAQRLSRLELRLERIERRLRLPPSE